MRRLEYRRPRSTTAFHVDFVVDGKLLHGRCRDASESGIRAELDSTAVVGSSGLLVLHRREGTVKRLARVAYLDGPTAGLPFLVNPTHEDDDSTTAITVVAANSVAG
jgi:PilZ domain